MFGFLAAHRRELFPDEMFRDLFPTGRGRPSVPADVMAVVITLQALHGLSDSETVDAVTFDLRWKTACGLAVTDGAFHATTSTYWRRRLAASVGGVGFSEPDLRGGQDGHRRDGGVGRQDPAGTGFHRARRCGGHQDTVTQLIAAIRRVRREVPGPPEVVAAQCNAHDYDDPGKPVIGWSTSWSATRTGCSATCPMRTSARRPPRRWRCWR